MRCTNTMRKLAGRIAAAVRIPFLHIADPVADAARTRGYRKLGLLGTRFTMEQPFMRERLQQQGLEVLVPQEADRAEVHRIIYEELCTGRILEESRRTYRSEEHTSELQSPLNLVSRLLLEKKKHTCTTAT